MSRLAWPGTGSSVTLFFHNGVLFECEGLDTRKIVYTHETYNNQEMESALLKGVTEYYKGTSMVLPDGKDLFLPLEPMTCEEACQLAMFRTLYGLKS